MKILKKIGESTNTVTYEYLVDTQEDFYKLNTNIIPMGSTCYIIDTGENFIINGSGYWEIYKNGNSENNGSSGVISHSELTGRNLSDQHNIESITGLSDKLQELSNKEVDIPTKLPNPYKLYFTGAVENEYDGSKEITVNIPTVKGESGSPGADGKSAYQIAIDNGFEGTEADWLESLKGEPGQPGTDGQQGADGEKGDPGDSAYEVAIKNGFEGTEQEWLASLKGEPGVQGEPGQDGQPGEEGIPGEKGDPGVGIQSIEQTTVSEEPGGVNIVTITKTDGSSDVFEVRNGTQGPKGEDTTSTRVIPNDEVVTDDTLLVINPDAAADKIPEWYNGTAVTAAGITEVTGSAAGDYYINTDTDCYYHCTAPNTWEYVGMLKGSDGSAGIYVGTDEAAANSSGAVIWVNNSSETADSILLTIAGLADALASINNDVSVTQYDTEGVGFIISIGKILIQTGCVHLAPEEANTTASTTVVFSKPYAFRPIVVSNVLTGSPQNVKAAFSNVTPTQMTFYLNRTNTTSTGADWVAIGLEAE